MARMTITIDEDLVNDAREALGAATKSEAIRAALLEVLRSKRLNAALCHQGEVELELEQEGLDELRWDFAQGPPGAGQ